MFFLFIKIFFIGLTSEGGGSVFFPVMTLALGIAPPVARDFSLNLQSFGMGAAMFTIFWMKVRSFYDIFNYFFLFHL